VTDPLRFQAHPEVWVLVLGVAALGVYAVRRIGPTATAPGEVVATRAQKAWFVAGLVTLWVASDWPLHDIAEEYLYSAHMVQHMLYSFAAVPMFLLATPTWLARMLVGTPAGTVYRAVRALTRVVPATLLFNVVVVFSHWPRIVNGVVDNGALHYGIHFLVVVTAALMWMGVCGPLPELRFALGAQMPYLFLQSIIPTVPAGWLTFAEGVVYDAYDKPFRLWGVSLANDQQLAGGIMKILGGLFLWTVIGILFIRFVQASEHSDRARGVPLDRRAPDDAVLTWAEVERELATAPPAPREA